MVSAGVAAGRATGDAVVLRLDGELQPTFSLWSVRLLGPLRRAVLESGMGGFKPFLDGIDWTPLDWPATEAAAFLNINDPATLAAARQRLAGRKEPGTC